MIDLFRSIGSRAVASRQVDCIVDVVRLLPEDSGCTFSAINLSTGRFGRY